MISMIYSRNMIPFGLLWYFHHIMYPLSSPITLPLWWRFRMNIEDLPNRLSDRTQTKKLKNNIWTKIFLNIIKVWSMFCRSLNHWPKTQFARWCRNPWKNNSGIRKYSIPVPLALIHLSLIVSFRNIKPRARRWSRWIRSRRIWLKAPRKKTWPDGQCSGRASWNGKISTSWPIFTISNIEMLTIPSYIKSFQNINPTIKMMCCGSRFCPSINLGSRIFTHRRNCLNKRKRMSWASLCSKFWKKNEFFLSNFIYLNTIELNLFIG